MGPRVAKIWIGFVIGLLTLAAYGRVCSNDFVNYDDPDYVTANPQIQSGLNPEMIRWAWRSFHAHNWHPLTWLSLALDRQLFGTRPWGAHLTNLVLHTANAILLFVALSRMTNDIWPSAAVATLFALHPLHVESVAWVSERKDVLSAFFWMLAVFTYASYAERPTWVRYSLIVVCMALGLMAKPMIMTLPFVLLLLDYWPLRRWPKGEKVEAPIGGRTSRASLPVLFLEKTPLIALAAASGVITLLAQGRAVIDWDYLPFSARAANALVAYVKYMAMMIWPKDLAVFYPHPLEALPVWKSVAAALVLGLISVAALSQCRRRPYFVVGWLWYLGTLAPVIGLIQVGNQALADRFTYVPLIGLFFILAWGLAELLRQRLSLKSPLILTACAGLTILAICSWIQVGYWQNSIKLWEHTLAVTADNPVAHNNLGVALWDNEQREEALSHFAEAYRLQPNYRNAQHNLEVAHYDLGLRMRQRGEWQSAEQHFLQVTHNNPGNTSAFQQRGIVLGILKRWQESGDNFKQAVNLEPRLAQYRADLALSFQEQGQIEAAQLQYREALRLDPGWSEAACRTAWTMATHPDAGRRDGGRALQLARQVCQAASKPRPENLDTLAAAYAELGQYSKAIESARAALELATSSSANPSGITQRLDSYERRQPWREGVGVSKAPN